MEFLEEREDGLWAFVCACDFSPSFSLDPSKSDFERDLEFVFHFEDILLLCNQLRFLAVGQVKQI